MQQVGEIQGHPVIYVPEKDVIFCKNTTVHYNQIKAAIYVSTLDREDIEGGKLTVTKDRGLITLGCLVTTIENISEIKSEILKIKRKYERANR